MQRKGNGGWLALCPSHDDRQRSLSLDIGSDGKLLIKCMAGCDPASVIAAKGLTWSDLFEDGGKQRQRGITTESLAASKALPLHALTRFGVRDIKTLTAAERLDYNIKVNEGVWIPYHNVDGSIAARTRVRTAHVAKDGSRWAGNFGAPVPYGLHDLADAREQGIVYLCEGESDYWTLREIGLPALGIPGAEMAAKLERSYLDDISTAYICQDDDKKGGASFVAGLRARLDPWGIKTIAIAMPDGCKDVNDLYRKDPKGCWKRLTDISRDAAKRQAPPAREFLTESDFYVLTIPEWELRLEIDQIRRPFGDLIGELAVISDHAGDVSRATVNLSSLDKRHGFANGLAKRSPYPDIDWSALLDEFALKVLRAEREGSPSVSLADLPRPKAEEAIDIDGVVMPRRHPSCLFGDGGTGKSYLALYFAGVLCRQGFRTGYIDAELSKEDHRIRLEQLFGLPLPPVEYLRLDRALVFAVDQIKRIVREKHLDYLVLDSVGVLTNGPPEAAEAANGYIRALRQIGIGTLSIAHITKAGEGNDQKPFGSVFYHNGFRCTWYAQQPDGDEAPDPNTLTIGLWNRKANLSRRARPCGLQLEFTEDAVKVRRVDISTVSGLSEKLPVWRQIEAILRRGPSTVEELAEELDVGENTVRTALSRGKKRHKFAILRDPAGDRAPRWALVDDRFGHEPQS